MLQLSISSHFKKAQVYGMVYDKYLPLFSDGSDSKLQPSRFLNNRSIGVERLSFAFKQNFNYICMNTQKQMLAFRVFVTFRL